MRILADGVGELGPGFDGNFAFDTSDQGTESQSSFEGHAMQRSSNVLPPAPTPSGRSTRSSGR